MTVKIVTDSTCDIPRNLARDMGLTVVPAYVLFGKESYREGAEIDEDEFYRRLVSGPVHPTTSVPTPQDFAAVYKSLAKETDEIISIHVSSKLSGTCDSALIGAEITGNRCRIRVLDSRSMGMGLLLTVMAAVKEVQAGCDLDEVTVKVHPTVLQIHNLAMADTLKYAVRSGRISKAQGVLGSALRIKVLLGVRDGDVFIWGLARTRAKAIERLHQFVRKVSHPKAVAIGYATNRVDAVLLSERLKAEFPAAQMYLTRIGAAVGSYGGPGAMGVGVME